MYQYIPLIAAGLLALVLVAILRRKRFRGRSTLKTLGLPNPDPLTELDLQDATTRNHVYVNKVLRHPYFQTMAHQPMHINDWIEIDKDYTWYLDEKARVLAKHGKTVLDSLPENDDGCTELLEVLVDYLPRRYPTIFESIRCSGGGIRNHVTGEKFEAVENLKGVEALRVVSRLVQDDFLMARERPGGHVYFTGGLVAFPGFYLLSEKINLSLATTHAPVPQFNEKLLISVERTLKRFKGDEPFERTSWEIVDDRNLFYHGIGLTEKVPEYIPPDDLWFRVDHQTFMKLPRSKAIIFGVHPIMKRLADFEDSPLVPALLATIHTHSDKKFMDYKLAPKYQDRMMPYLKEMTKRQIDRGLIHGDEAVSTFRKLIEKEGKQAPSTQTSLRTARDWETSYKSDSDIE